jgi:hypothetical protein
MSIISVQTTAASIVHSDQFVEMPGLSLNLPQASATEKQALVILNVPEPYAKGNNFPGIIFGIRVGGTMIATGGFTYSQKQPESFGRQPFTLVVAVKLQNGKQTHVEAQWQSVRGSEGNIDSFASLSAITG